MKRRATIAFLACLLLAAPALAGGMMWICARKAQTVATSPASWTPPQSAGLAGWYKFADETAVTAGHYADSSGNGNDATQSVAASRAPWVSTEDGSIDLDGTADHVVCPSALEFSTHGTIAVWFRHAVADANYQTLYCDRNGTATELVRINRIPAGALEFAGYDGGGYQFRIYTANLTDTNSYHLVCGTFTNNSAIVYLDGIQASADTSCTIDMSGHSLGALIGKEGSVGWVGNQVIAEVLVWTGAALSSNEQYQVYQHFAP